MALQVSAATIVALLLTVLPAAVPNLRPCQVGAEEAEAVSLNSFTVGVTYSALRRYRVEDIRVGGVSVWRLFEDPNAGRTDPGWKPGGYLWPEDIRLKINGDETISTDERLNELKRVLIAHPDFPLEVVLRDRIPVWSSLSRLGCAGLYEYSIRIPVTFDLTTCDKVTRVIYEKVISRVMREGDGGRKDEGAKMERQADRHLDVNELFEKLRADGEIEAYLNSLGPATYEPCVETLRLLKERRERKATRFGFGEYEISKEIQDGLELIINAAQLDPGWWKSELSIRAIGYTDKVEVNETKDLHLLMAKTGINADVWAKVEHPLEVYYDGCKGDRAGADTAYLSFPAGEGGQRVGRRIINNCELGAVRAYVAMIYLTNRLGRKNPDDAYATGGVYSGEDTQEGIMNDPEKRRIHVEFIIKAARVE